MTLPTATLRTLCLLAVLIAPVALAGDLTPATGGENIPTRSAGNSYTELDGPVFDETAQGQVDEDLVLRIPDGFEWDPDSSPRARVTLINPPKQGGRNINNKANGEFIEGAEVTISGRDIIFSITQKTTGNRRNRLEFEGLRVRPTVEDDGASGDILQTGNAELGDLPRDASWGLLRQVRFDDDVLMFVNGKTPGPVTVTRGETVDFAVSVRGCDRVSAARWRYTWFSGDGEQQQETRNESPCDASPIPYEHVYQDLGLFESGFRAEFCASQPCSPDSFELFGQTDVEVSVTLPDVRGLYNFHFDEQVWDGTEGEVREFSGNNLLGTAMGAQTRRDEPAVAGDRGTCGYGVFDGNDRVRGPGNFRVNSADSFSVAAWVRLSGTEQGSSQPVLMAYGPQLEGFAERFQLSLDITAGVAETVFGIRTQEDDIVSLRTSAGTDPLSGDWLHLAATYDSVTSEAVIFMNGEEVAREEIQAPPGNQDPDLPGDTNGDLTLMAYGDGSRGAVGNMDEPRIFDGILTGNDVQALLEETRNCPRFGELDQLVVSVPETASVCTPAPVDITALDANGNRIENYTGTLDLSTSSGRGNWSLGAGAQGALDPPDHNSNDGAARYAFAEDDNGQVTLRLENSSADELRVTATDGDASVSGTSGTVQYQENAFVIIEDDPLGRDFVAGRDHQLLLRAERRDENGECGTIEAYDGHIDLKGWITRGDQDPGGEAPVLSGEAGAARMPDSEPAGNNITVAFSQGLAPLQWQTGDVGQHRLTVRDDSSGAVVDANGSPIPVTGSAMEWAVRPFGFDLSVADNPGAEGPEGAAFLAAGRAFSVSLRAVLWDAASDSNGDGLPDNHDGASPGERVSLADNATAGSFAVPGDSLSLSALLAAGPTNASDPDLELEQPVADFADGLSGASARYQEVGSIGLRARFDQDYLGRSVQIRGDSGFVGRFHPEAFTASLSMEGAFAPFCENFAYIGQDFGYIAGEAPELTLSPRGFSPDAQWPLLSNYREDWQRLQATDVALSFPQQDDDNGLAVETTADTGLLVPLGDGRMDYRFAATDQFRYLKNDQSRIDPFPSALSVTLSAVDDGDAGLAAEQAPDGDFPVIVKPRAVELRYGRLRLENTYGPADMELVMPLRAEFRRDGGFVLNLSESGASEGEGECFVYNPVQDASLDPQDVAEVTSQDGDFQLLSGEPEEGGRLTLKALSDRIEPGEPNQVRVNFSVPLWLQDDFNRDGELSNPAATATFGVYRGHDRIIYWRELSQ
ncbi:MAG: LamG domain-containing protein [Oleiphilaceae bacterium]|nr:LamG domain-containing protein [Oleiphilaceae bacterium]